LWLYVDKPLSGVAAVQTLSRLNRIARGKDQTFVLDFANSAEEIVEAFEAYYEATTLADVTDPNIVHETMAKLDAVTIYHDSEVEGLVRDFLAHKGNNAPTKWITPARDRFRDRERTAVDRNDKVALDELEMFRKDVGTFLRQYDFLSQSRKIYVGATWCSYARLVITTSLMARMQGSQTGEHARCHLVLLTRVSTCGLLDLGLMTPSLL
jgi:type I site-specific restriction-modification system R (restriction) subunit